MAKLLVLDIETTGFDANRGHILCAVAKWVGEKRIYKWRLDDTPGFGSTPGSWFNDAEICKSIKLLVEQADAVIAYYGGYGRFDIPYINTRLIAASLEPLPPVTVIDPHKAAKSKLKLARNSLDAVSTLFQTNTRKGFVPWEHWLKAQYGERKSMKILLDYCVKDVQTLEELYVKIRPLITDHPHVTASVEGNDPRTQCTTCGSYDSQSRGTRRTRQYQIFRRCCSNCGSFFESSRKKLK